MHRAIRASVAIVISAVLAACSSADVGSGESTGPAVTWMTPLPSELPSNTGTPASPGPSETATPTSSSTVIPTPAPASALIVGLETWHEMGAGSMVSIHADGRVLSAEGGRDSILERRLSPEGLTQIVALVDGDPLLAASADYIPQVLPGNQVPGRGGYVRVIFVGRDDENMTVSFAPLLDHERPLFEPTPEIDHLVEVAALLEDLAWLPDTAWLDAAPDPYVPGSYILHLQEGPYDCCNPAVDAADADALRQYLSGPWEQTPRGERFACWDADADTGARIRMELASVPYSSVGDTASLLVEGWVDDELEERTYHATLRAALPDGAGCDA